MSSLEKFILWITFIGMVVLAIFFFTQKPSTAMTELSDRVGGVEAQLQDTAGNAIDLKQYQRWAESVDSWAQQVQAYLEFLDGALTTTPPGEDVICPACLEAEGENPPGGGPCKPTTC